MTETITPPLTDPLSTRYSLLSRLQDWGDQESWMDFFDTYWRLIYSLARRSGLNETEAHDVVQETVISVAKNIHKFKRDRALGSFKSWLRNIIRWRISDQLRKRMPDHAEGSGLASVPDENVSSPDTVWDSEWQANLLEAAISRVKRRVKEEHYLAFDLYVVKQRPPAEIAKTLRITVSQVYVHKHRVSALIKKEIRILEKKLF